MKLVSFDGTEQAEVDESRPSRYSSLKSFLAVSGAVPRGAGLSYCGAALSAHVVSSVHFDRILSFNEASGLLTVEPGITLGKIFDFSAPKGWHLSVMPGHPAITVGGCVGANVHGKNQHAEGCFAAVVEELTLYHPERGETKHAKGSETFALTLGGFGLTGFVTAVTLRLKKIPSEAFLLTRIPVGGYEEAVAVMRAHETASSLYSWHQPCGRGFVSRRSPCRAVPRRVPHGGRWIRKAAPRAPRCLTA